MKNEHKVFIIYFLMILLYGLSYIVIGPGKFAFSKEYSDFGLGIIAIALFIHKKMSKYSFLLITFGFSLFYLISYNPQFNLIDSSAFNLIRNVSVIIFGFFLIGDLKAKKIRKYQPVFWIFSLGIIAYYILQFTDLEMIQTSLFRFYKNTIGFILVAILLRLDRDSNKINSTIKRVLVVIGLSFFIDGMNYLVG